MHTQAEQEDRLNTEGSDRLAQTVVINCGRALAQAVDEQDLLQSVCNALVNNCGFRLAWVGLTEPGTSNSIRLVAQAGDQDGFLQEPRCSETPATLAIQAGESCCIKAIADSPLVVPIRAAALKRGYTSVVSLPLKSDGTLFGALTIYADDPGKLDEPIVERLRQWSDLFALRVKTLPVAPRSATSITTSKYRCSSAVGKSASADYRYDTCADPHLPARRLPRLLQQTLGGIPGSLTR